MGHGHVDLLPELFDSEGDASDGSQGVSVGRAVYEASGGSTAGYRS